MIRTVFVAGVMVSLLSACTSSENTAQTGGGLASSSAAPSTASASITPDGLPPLRDVVVAGGTRLEVPGEPDWLLLAGGSVWTNTEVSLSVTRIDQATGEVLGTVPVEGTVCLAMDAGYGSVWFATCGTPSMVRLDPKTGRKLAVIPLPVEDVQSESSVAAGAGGVWVLSADGATLVKVDPVRNKVTRTYRAPDRATAVRAGFGFLWITSFDNNSLSRVDPKTAKIVTTIPVGQGPRFLAVGEEGVWVLNQTDGTVSHVDPQSGTVVATVKVDEYVEGGDIAVGGGAVWARVSQGLVARIDPDTDTVTDRYGPTSGSGSVAADSDAAWISAHDSDSVWRLSSR